jgi:magnesium chelatase subunit I
VVPRISDLPYVIPTITGKVEFETVEDGKEEQIIEKLIQGAVVAVFNRYFNVVDLEEVVTRFKAGVNADVGDTMAPKKYVELMRNIEGLAPAVAKLNTGENSALVASAIEFVLEGLHLNKRLNKDRVGGRVQYRG